MTWDLRGKATGELDDPSCRSEEKIMGIAVALIISSITITAILSGWSCVSNRGVASRMTCKKRRTVTCRLMAASAHQRSCPPPPRAGVCVSPDGNRKTPVSIKQRRVCGHPQLKSTPKTPWRSSANVRTSRALINGLVEKREITQLKPRSLELDSRIDTARAIPP